MEFPGHVNGSGLSHLCLVRGRRRRRVPSRVFEIVLAFRNSILGAFKTLQAVARHASRFRS